MLPPHHRQLFDVAAKRVPSELEREKFVERAQLYCLISKFLYCLISKLAEDRSNFVEEVDGGPILFVWSGLEVDVHHAERGRQPFTPPGWRPSQFGQNAIGDMVSRV